MPSRRISLTIALGLTLVACFVLPASSSAYSSSVKYGKWRATVTYQRQSGSGEWARYKKLRVTIRRGRSAVVRKRVLVAERRDALFSEGRPLWKVVNFDHDGSPEFLLSWMSGCTHSCIRANAFGIGPARAMAVPVYMWDGFSVEDVDGDGIAELVGRDSRFSYQFATYASSAYPVQINSLASGSVTDVTRSFPGRIGANAAALLERWNDGADSNDGGGVALAYAAELCRLGRRSEAMTFLDHAENSTSVMIFGELELGYDPEYAEQAEQFLISVGYC
jgi:hypothetical protein